MNNGRVLGVARILVVVCLAFAPSGCKDADTVSGVQPLPTLPPPTSTPTPGPTGTQRPPNLIGTWTGVFRDEVRQFNFVTRVDQFNRDVAFSFDVWRFNGFIYGPGAHLAGALRMGGQRVATLSGQASATRIDLSGSQYSIVLSRP